MFVIFTVLSDACGTINISHNINYTVSLVKFTQSFFNLSNFISLIYINKPIIWVFPHLFSVPLNFPSFFSQLIESWLDLIFHRSYSPNPSSPLISHGTLFSRPLKFKKKIVLMMRYADHPFVSFCPVPTKFKVVFKDS